MTIFVKGAANVLLKIGGELDYLNDEMVFSSITKSFYIRKWMDKVHEKKILDDFCQKRLDFFI